MPGIAGELLGSGAVVVLVVIEVMVMVRAAVVVAGVIVGGTGGVVSLPPSSVYSPTTQYDFPASRSGQVTPGLISVNSLLFRRLGGAERGHLPLLFALRSNS